MDIARPDLERKKKLRTRIVTITAIVAAIGFTVFVLTLKAPLQSVEADQIWTGTVQRGTMLRNLRGMGKLVPENVRWIAARAPGRVEERYLLSGAEVHPDTPILKLSNPELEQKLGDAKLQLDSAQAEMDEARVRLQGELLALKSNVEALREETELAALDAKIQNELFADNLTSSLNRERAELHSKHSAIRLKMEEERLDFQNSSIEHQLASKKASMEQAKAQYALLQEQVNALIVKAGFDGVIQRLDLEPGMQVEQGALIAQVADMNKLKAVVEIQEAQAREVQIGQSVTIDTRTSGDVQGLVARVDPNVENGIVKVDVHFDNALPDGCRAEQTVQGTIELERLDDVVYMPRPAAAQPDSATTIFRMEKGGREATRIHVSYGRASVSQIEVRNGVKPGDKVILSDTSRWEKENALRIK